MKVSNINIPLKENYTEPTAAFDNNAKDFQCRDPFVMPYGDKYYLYKTNGKEIVCRVSPDLEKWSDEIVVFSPPADFHGINDLFWAPECHYYKGRFYIFTSCYSSITDKRAISVYRADDPLGPFEDIAGGCITPREWSAIDGTLYIDESGLPWMIFVHEWVSMPDENGSFAAARLSKDLTHFVSEPVTLFYAKDLPNATSGVTDGCYIVRLDSGKLMMIWSNFREKGYLIAKAASESGKISGPWKQEGILYEKDLRGDFECDGGHGMIFKTKQDKFMLALHSPNAPTAVCKESLRLYEITETDETIKIL